MRRSYTALHHKGLAIRLLGQAGKICSLANCQTLALEKCDSYSATTTLLLLLDTTLHKPYDALVHIADLAKGIPVDDFLTPPEIAKLLRVSPDTVRRLIDSGALPGTRLTDDSGAAWSASS